MALCVQQVLLALLVLPSQLALLALLAQCVQQVLLGLLVHGIHGVLLVLLVQCVRLVLLALLAQRVRKVLLALYALLVLVAQEVQVGMGILFPLSRKHLKRKRQQYLKTGSKDQASFKSMPSQRGMS